MSEETTKRKSKAQIAAEERAARMDDLIGEEPGDLRAMLETNLRKISRVKSDAREYAKAAREVIKEAEDDNDIILEVLEDLSEAPLLRAVG